jgi:hypothetical protein
VIISTKTCRWTHWLSITCHLVELRYLNERSYSRLGLPISSFLIFIKTFKHRQKWPEKLTSNTWMSHLHKVTDVVFLAALVLKFEICTKTHKQTNTLTHRDVHRCIPVRCGNNIHYLLHSSRRIFTLLSQINKINYHINRSQWPRGLWFGSACARVLGLRIWILPGAWISVSCKGCVLSGRGLCVGLITRTEEFYTAWCAWGWSWCLDNEKVLVH